MSTRWVFTDSVTPESYSLAINPNAGGTPTRKKSIMYMNTSGPDGKTLVFEGRDEVQTLEVSGILLTQAQLETFQDWFDKRHQFKITDDLGREFWVYMTSLDMKRIRARSHPWKHEFSISCVILDWA